MDFILDGIEKIARANYFISKAQRFESIWPGQNVHRSHRRPCERVHFDAFGEFPTGNPQIAIVATP